MMGSRILYLFRLDNDSIITMIIVIHIQEEDRAKKRRGLTMKANKKAVKKDAEVGNEADCETGGFGGTCPQRCFGRGWGRTVC